MSKPSVGGFGASPTIEQLNTDLDTLASKFDQAIVDSDISTISYSKLTLGGNIVNADINAAAAIVGSKIAAGSIDGLTRITASTVDYAAMLAGAVNRLQDQASTGAIVVTDGTATDITGATLTITPPAAGTKILCFATARFTQDSNSGTVTLLINIDGTDQTEVPGNVFMDGSGSQSRSAISIATASIGPGAEVVKLVAQLHGVTGGNLDYSVASGDAHLWVVQFKKAD